MSFHIVNYTIQTLAKALHEWKCPGCGGTGVYEQDAAGRARAIAQGRVPEMRYQPGPVTCKVCGGTGLHPTAFAALHDTNTLKVAP